MKKHAFTVIAAVFGFACGVYFYSSLPAPTREIASKNLPGDMKVSNALKECISDRVRDNKIQMSKVDVDGRSWAILSIDCVGEKAKILYETVTPYSDEQYVRYSDGRRGVGRFFGKLYPPSQCVRLIRNARGNEMNLYSCSLRLDLDGDLIQNLKL